MSASKIIGEIKRGNPSPVYFLHGEEPYFIDQIISTIESDILDEMQKAFNFVVLYGKEVDFKQVVDYARQFPMMSPKRVVIVKEAQQMRSLEKLESYMQNPSPDTVLAIAYKNKKLDGRTKFAKTVKSNALVFESKRIYENKVGEWISNYVQEADFKIDNDANRLLAEYIGTNLSKLSNELDKLFLNCGVDKRISYDEVIEFIGINRDYNVFELRKHLSNKNFSKAIEICNYFGKNPKNNPIQMIIPSIYSFFAQVFIAKGFPRANDSELAAAIGVNRFFVGEYKTAAKKYASAEIQNAFKALKNADLKSKGIGNRSFKEKQILHDLIFALAYPQAHLQSV